MRRERACLGALPATTRELLGLRAGLSGPPLSRSEAASRLGISHRRAGRIERRGLSALHSACGGAGGSGGGSSPGGVSPRLVRLATGAPTLQPAVYLPASSAPALRSAADLGHPRGEQGVKGATASSPPENEGPVAASAPPPALGEEAAGDATLPIVLAACLAALAALLLVGLRRRAVATQGGPVIVPAVVAPRPPRETASPRTTPAVAPAPQPPAADEPEPHETGWVGPSADRAATETASPTAADSGARSRITRSVSVVGSGLISLAVRELVRRRGRR